MKYSFLLFAFSISIYRIYSQSPCCDGFATGYKFGLSFPNYTNVNFVTSPVLCDCYKIISGSAGYKEGYDLGFAKGLSESKNQVKSYGNNTSTYTGNNTVPVHTPYKYSEYIPEVSADDYISVMQRVQERINNKTIFYNNWMKNSKEIHSSLVRPKDKEWMGNEYNKCYNTNSLAFKKFDKESALDIAINNVSIFENNQFYRSLVKSNDAYLTRMTIFKNYYLNGNKQDTMLEDYMYKQRDEALYWEYSDDIYKTLENPNFSNFYIRKDLGYNGKYSINFNFQKLGKSNRIFYIFINETLVGFLNSENDNIFVSELLPNGNYRILISDKTTVWKYNVLIEDSNVSSTY